MPPLFVDGVEIASVFVDGVEQQNVFADGVEVFTSFSGEDYNDTFQGSGQTRNVAMDSGQFWSVLQSTPTQPVHQAGVWGAVGSRVSNIHNENGTETTQEIQPIVSIINPSFVASASFSWSPPTAIANFTGITLGSASRTDLRCDGIIGNYTIQLIINDVLDEFVDVPFIDVVQCDLAMYYDGIDVAATVTARDSIGGVFNYTFTRRSAQGTFTVNGRTYLNAILPLFAFIFMDAEIYNVQELGIPPGDIPWPT